MIQQGGDGNTPFVLRGVVVALEEALHRVPRTTSEAAERAQTVSRIIRALDHFDVDGESLLRYGMSHRAAMPIYVALLTSLPDSPLIDVERWREVLKVTARADLDEGVNVGNVSHVPHMLDTWVANASLSEIMHFRAPSDSSWEQFSLESEPPPEVVDAYHWLWQRYTVPDEARWMTTSLHLEYRWRREAQASSFAETAIEPIGLMTAELNAEIARRAVAPSGDVAESSMIWEMQEAAARYLQSEKYAEASALFEFHRQRTPNDPRAVNNLGFCRFPIDPSEALHLMQEASRLGYEEPAISVYNQCCCLEALNRSREAPDLAEFYWQRQRRANVSHGYLWVYGDGAWRLSGNAHAEIELTGLAGRVSKSLGLESRQEVWAERADSLVVKADGP